MAKVIVTGATGFIGRSLVPTARACGYGVIPVLRRVRPAQQSGSQNKSIVRAISNDTDWSGLLGDIDTIIHLAGIAHQRGSFSDIEAFRSVNVEGTRRLAQAAAKAGVRRFIFLSSIKVLGEQTKGKPFSASDKPDPQDAYAISKMEAEAALQDVETRTKIEVVIIRPPLVYGPFVKGNLAALSALIERGVPIPSAGIRNRRDLISVDNLCDLILTCIRHPAAAGKTFLACDGQALSTHDIVRLIAAARGRTAREIYVPRWLLLVALTAIGKRAAFSKLAGDLEIDMQATKDTLNWVPPYSVEECFKKL